MVIRDARVQAAVPKLIDSITLEPVGKAARCQENIGLLTEISSPLMMLSSRLKESPTSGMTFLSKVCVSHLATMVVVQQYDSLTAGARMFLTYFYMFQSRTREATPWVLLPFG